MVTGYKKSIVEKLADTSSGLEIWWDSSPLIYENWANKLISEAPAEDRELIKDSSRVMFDPKKPAETIFRGVTTNPPLSLNAIKDNPEFWAKWIKDYVKIHPYHTVEQVYWGVYKEIVKRGAETYLPVFESSHYRFGHISGQVDPRSAFNEEVMFQQALELSKLSPNVMIKVPQTAAGINVFRRLTALGIATNGTLGYTNSQFVAVAEAVQAGLLEARANGVNLSKWRSVVTDMSVRWENGSEFEPQAKEAGIDLTVEDKRMASIAVFKRACRIYRERSYTSKMLICSLRMGPTVDNVERIWHLEMLGGAEVVFTLPPGYLSEMFLRGKHIEFKNTIWDDIPEYYWNRLVNIPYFTRAMDPHGYKIEEFDNLSPVQTTYKEFSGATQKMIDFVKEAMK